MSRSMSSLSSSKAEAIHSEEKNYLSHAYQEAVINTTYDAFATDIEKYVAEKQNEIDSLNKKIEKKVDNKKIVNQLRHVINKVSIAKSFLLECNILKNNFLSTLSEDKEDNTKLLDYFNELKEILLASQNALLEEAKRYHKQEKSHSAFSRYFDKAKEVVLAMQQQLKTAIDFQVYEVHIPIKEYEKMMKKAESLPFKGATHTAWSVAAETAGITILGAMGIVAAIATLPLLPFWIKDRLISEATPEPEDVLEPKKYNTHGYFPTLLGVCNTCKQDIPPTWIAGRIEFDPSASDKSYETGRTGFRSIDPNPNYHHEEKFKTIFILDGKNPKAVYANGTNYHFSDNKQGCVYFFDNPYDARGCARLLADGKKYHPNLGFRRHNDWEPAQIEAALSQINANEMKRSNAHNDVIQQSTLPPSAPQESFGNAF